MKASGGSFFCPSRFFGAFFSSTEDLWGASSFALAWSFFSPSSTLQQHQFQPCGRRTRVCCDRAAGLCRNHKVLPCAATLLFTAPFPQHLWRFAISVDTCEQTRPIQIPTRLCFSVLTHFPPFLKTFCHAGCCISTAVNSSSSLRGSEVI